jgi:hypothetical protein
VTDYLDHIVGQNTAKRFIRTALKKGSLYNFLLIGPRGVGKRTFGFRLAKTVGCPPNSPNFMLVGPIPSKLKDKEEKIYEYTCRYLPENTTITLEDRSAILIQQIRHIIERLMYMPQKGEKRVVLILEADRMTDPAANCFLKTLEEPPIDTFFVLTSSRPDYLLPTIRSRCRTVPFTYLSRTQVQSVIFEGSDDYLTGSPGEMLLLQERTLIEHVFPLFKSCPLNPETVAKTAYEYERKNAMDLFYPLLLLYRLAFYRKLNAHSITHGNSIFVKKSELPLPRLVATLRLLNDSINALEGNPNHLLLLYNVLTKLP